MKKSRLISLVVFLILFVAIAAAILINVENRLKKEVKHFLENNHNVEAEDVNIRFFRWFPDLAIELEGAALYLRKDRRVYISSPSIVAKFDLFKILSDRKNLAQLLKSLESKTNTLGIEKGEKLKFVSDYSFKLSNQKTQFLLESRLKNAQLNGERIDFPEMEFNAPIQINIQQNRVEIKEAEFKANDVIFGLNAFMNRKKFKANSHTKTDSSHTKLILPLLFFNRVVYSKGQISSLAEATRDSSQFSYQVRDADFSIDSDSAQLALNLQMHRGSENDAKLQFELSSFSNKHLEHLRYFSEIKKLSKYYQGKFNLNTQADFRLSNSFRLIRESLNAKGSISSAACVLENSAMIKEMQKMFGDKYAQLKIKDIKADYEIINGNTRLYPCEFMVDKVKWTADVRITKEDELDGSITIKIPFQDIKFSDDVSSLVNLALSTGIIKKASIVSIDVKLSGTMQKPKFKIDVSRLLNKYIGMEKNSSDNLGKSINSFLNNLFR